MSRKSCFILAAVAALAGATGAHAQSRPFDQESPTEIALLGACPVELLRDAWSELGPLEASAVEAEVIDLCTARSQAIRGLVTAYGQLEAAVGDVLGPQADPTDAPDALDPARESSDVADAMDARSETRSRDLGAAANTEEDTSSEPEHAAVVDTGWHVLFVTRSGEDEWRAALQRSQRVTIWPDVTDAANAVERAFEWVRESGPLLIVREADELPNGFVIVRIDTGSVQVAPLGGGTGADLPWVDGGDPSTPGNTDWSWTVNGVPAGDTP